MQVLQDLPEGREADFPLFILPDITHISGSCGGCVPDVPGEMKGMEV